MTTQVFRARTLLEAREQAAQTLGKGAIILTTREVKRAGLGGMFGGTDVEVAAAVLGPATESQARHSARPFAPSAYAQAPARPRATTEERETLASLRAEVHGEMRAMKLALARNTAPAADLAAEIVAIREMLDQMTPSARGDKLAKLVAARGIEGAAATTILRAMRALPEGDADERLRATLAALIEVAPWPLLDLRHEIARDAKGLAAVLASSESDVILVDTSGRPFRADSAEGLLIPERFAALDGASALSRHVLLCMPASVRWIDAVRTAKSFAAAQPVAIAMTKTDETDAPSGLVHAALASKLPLSILCTGPRVPEDIEPATSSAVVERVCGQTKSGKAR
jgi:flagellar biosynthesis protein FlhF